MPLPRARAGLLVAVTVASLTLAACSTTPETVVTEDALPSPNATSPEPTATAEPSEDSAAGADPGGAAADDSNDDR